MNADSIKIESDEDGVKDFQDLRLYGRPPSEAFWEMVAYVGADSSDCWLWTGSKHTAGYGWFRGELAHRFAYEDRVIPIPGHLQIDHLCRVRRCVNPAHLEVVTSRENSLRGEHPNWETHRTGVCKRGHARTPENVLRSGACRACNIEYCQERRQNAR